jgi:DNA-binding transcriptional LysR family regulator
MDRPRGQLNIGSISSAISSLFPAALNYLYKEHPELELVLGPGTSTYLMEAVTAGHLDCALIVQPPYEISKALRWSFVRDEPFVMLAPRARNFADVHEALAQLPLIKPLGWTGQMVSRIIRDMQINIHEPYVLDATDAVSMLISSGAGVAIVADYGFPIDEEKIQKTVIDSARYKRTIGFISPYQSGKQLMFDVLLEAIRGAAKKIEEEEERLRA